MTEKFAEAAALAIKHLDDADYPGRFDLDSCRELYRHGQRDLALELSERAVGQWAS